MKKLGIIIGLIVVVGLAVVLVLTQPKKESEKIKIGAILPLTGEDAKLGESAKKGVILAAEEINKKGKQKIEVIFEDTQGQPTIAINAFKKLITFHKVPVVIGELSSSVTLAVAPLAEKSHTILISPSASAPKISEAGDYIFRVCASDIFEGKEMAKFIHQKLKYKKIGILYINNDYGIGLKDAFQQEFTNLGGKIVAVESFEQGGTDFKSQLAKIKLAHPDGVYMPGYAKEMALILKEAKEIGLHTRFFSSISFEDPQILELAKEESEGVIYTAYGYDPERQIPNIQKFVQMYKSKFNEIPDIYAALSYDATQVIMEAINKSESLNSQTIKENLYGIKNFPGVTGEITFDKNGDVVHSITIKTVKDGKFVYYPN
jgi:branched-chain amino acid transport system substrate-binding protein